MTARPTPGALESAWYDDLVALLSSVKEMQRSHQQRLDVHRDADGVVREGEYAAYEDVRYETAVEAADALDSLAARLELVLTAVPTRAFTIALRSPGHQEGARSTLFVVSGTHLDDAYRSLLHLPGYRRWLEEFDIVGATDGSGTYLPAESHPGMRSPGSYIDLRAEQAPAHSARTPHHASLPPGPPATGPGRLR
ncbi:hypothetical protein AB0M94_21585 [Streptomyces xanthochromogenes]|uniref:hypothetical protein n=1 Tax=Streptomyces xanthochromogenes TaxID=67384 RepID=UPI00343B9307